MTKPRSADWSPIYDRLRGYAFQLYTHSTNAEKDTSTLSAFSGFDTMDGVRIGNDPSNWYTNNGTANQIDYYIRRAPGFFDVVCYTGNLSSTARSHSLGVSPELIIIKPRSDLSPISVTGNWVVFQNTLGANNLYLNTNDSLVAAGISLNANTTTFTTTAWNPINANGYNFVAYLFATLPGVSKVGSYTGTGTTLSIDCGFTSGARFVMIKRTDSTGDWYVWDSARGIIAGNDPYLLLNSTAAEVTNTDYIDPYNPGFELSSTAPVALNASGGTYIFLAIA